MVCYSIITDSTPLFKDLVHCHHDYNYSVAKVFHTFSVQIGGVDRYLLLLYSIFESSIMTVFYPLDDKEEYGRDDGWQVGPRVGPIEGPHVPKDSEQKEL
jgi:hypothetical protein